LKKENNFTEFKNKRILVTGAGAGIGKKTAYELLKKNCEVIVLDKNINNLNTLSRQFKGKIVILNLDLKNSENIQKTIGNKKFKKIDGIVHCAGSELISPIKNFDEKKFNEVFQVNTTSFLIIIKNLLKLKKMKKNSSIVLISSILANVGSFFNSGYSASKSSLHGICKSLAIELSPNKMRVNCIAPGFVKTNMLKKVSKLFPESYIKELEKLHPLGLGNTIDISNLIIFLLSNKSKWITGSIINIDGGFSSK